MPLVAPSAATKLRFRILSGNKIRKYRPSWRPCLFMTSHLLTGCCRWWIAQGPRPVHHRTTSSPITRVRVCDIVDDDVLHSREVQLAIVREWKRTVLRRCSRVTWNLNSFESNYLFKSSETRAGRCLKCQFFPTIHLSKYLYVFSASSCQPILLQSM